MHTCTSERLRPRPGGCCSPPPSASPPSAAAAWSLCSRPLTASGCPGSRATTPPTSTCSCRCAPNVRRLETACSAPQLALQPAVTHAPTYARLEVALTRSWMRSQLTKRRQHSSNTASPTVRNALQRPHTLSECTLGPHPLPITNRLLRRTVLPLSTADMTRPRAACSICRPRWPAHSTLFTPMIAERTLAGSVDLHFICPPVCLLPVCLLLCVARSAAPAARPVLYRPY